jgi:hypothetical protein
MSTLANSDSWQIGKADVCTHGSSASVPQSADAACLNKHNFVLNLSSHVCQIMWFMLSELFNAKTSKYECIELARAPIIVQWRTMKQLQPADNDLLTRMQYGTWLFLRRNLCMLFSNRSSWNVLKDLYLMAQSYLHMRRCNWKFTMVLHRA